MKRVYSICLSTMVSLILLFPCSSFAKTTVNVKMPSSVLNISKDNTYPNVEQDLPRLQPSELAKELLKTSSIRIENPDLIRMFNETSISNAPLAVGYRAKIYLGQWPLNYESLETTMNWEYKQVSRNVYDNRGVERYYPLRYKQESQKIVEGGLTAYIKDAEDVKKMMLLQAMEKVQLPLSFKTTIGYGTGNARVYNISPKQLGYLYAYTPAVNEKGKVTFGEVYLVLKGNQKRLLIKNITSQGIGASIPIQDHLSFKFISSPQPQ
ncbi:YfkD family protein [Bacillus sp. DX4.1]|uniref:YfkD famly protein n=1 Tax=Bacillus sp. DX4.1 TaxID=3055867 RepID=UPI0025A2E93F|nr:YfkD famly protein [Bacillus sp. DX4.1]MDM5186942.1 YfkD family protein [Bacillus sp. DX4.1]